MSSVPPAATTPLALASGVKSGLVAALVAALSLWTRTPFLFPALGASTFIVIAFPHLPAARPRNVIGSHVVGAAAGWACYRLFGLDAIGATLVSGGGWQHVAAAALALGSTTGLLLALGLHHPPAGATTLIVALGFLPHAWQIAMVGASATLLVLLARLMARPRARAG